MNVWLIAGPCLASWLIASRVLFRHWWKYDSLMGYRPCPKPGHWSHYRAMDYTFADKCCLAGQHERYPMPMVVGLAMLAGLAWPLMVAAGLVIWRKPRSVAETEARIRELEKELSISQKS